MKENNHSPVLLYPHQQDAIRKLKNGSILVGGVGSGKTLTALGYVVRVLHGGKHPALGDKTLDVGKTKDVYVITTARKRDSLDWEKEAAYLSLNVRVDSWNNIKKYKDVRDSIFIFDEQRLVGYGVWVKTFLKIAKNNSWILLTATPGDSWMEYAPVFIANGFYINKTHFERSHVVYSSWSKFPKIERYLNVNELVKYRDSIVVYMPFVRKTKRHNVILKLKYDKNLYKLILKDRWNPYNNTPIQTITDCAYTLRKCVNSDLSRLTELKGLFLKHKKIIVFYNFNYELDILRSFCNKEHISFREWNGHKHEPIFTEEHPDEWIYLCQYTSASEAWNATETNVIVFFSQTYSYKVLEQASGRIDRINTSFTDLWYYHFLSNSHIDLGIRKALNDKRTFNETLFFS